MSVRPAVWITGVGAATPLGNDYARIAEALLNGRSAVGRVSRFDVREHPSQIAAQLDTIPCPSGWNPAAFSRYSRIEQLAIWCCSAALRDAGWWDRRETARIGLVLGVGSEWMLAWEEDSLRGGQRARHPEEDTESLVQFLRRTLGIGGPVLSLSAACASGNCAIAQARRWIELGWVDACLAGGCDLAVTPMSLAGFGNLRALSRRNDNPQAASRPFDVERDGFVMGEGGTVFVLESAASARNRDASPYAHVAGCGASSDAHHMVIPSPDPKPAIACMRQALADAGVAPGDVGYINAHATGTPVGDTGEARVIQGVFGEWAKKVPVSSTKSMTGHLLTAAAALEALACIIALHRQALPPTINLDHPDPECDLCHVANQAMERRTRVAASNSFGFGGSNTTLVLKAVA